LPEIIEHTNLDPEQFCPPAYGRRKASVFEPADWREWGFRKWRVRRNLQSLTAEVVSP
jgi:hypothetical protein